MPFLLKFLGVVAAEIRPHIDSNNLNNDVSVMVANALVSSRLGCCNSLFHSLFTKNITRI